MLSDSPSPDALKIASFRLRFAIACGLVLVTAGVYFQTLHQDFTNYDDNWYVTDNPHVKTGLSGENLRWAVTSFELCYWQPLTWMSLQFDSQFSGCKSWLFKLDNLILHLINTVLLFYLLERMTRSVWPSAFVAALFALHPLHVESVAWIVERKDVLSTLFWLLTLLFYFRYVRTSSKLAYGLAVLCMAAGLTSKPMLVTLPFVLLLMDYWPLRRLRRAVSPDHGLESPSADEIPVRKFLFLLIEKIPFFFLTVLSCLMTLYVNRVGGAMASAEVFSFPLRVQNALVSYCLYLMKMFWPVNLVVFYPLPDKPYSTGATVAAVVFLAGFTIFAVFQAVRRDRRWFLIGWLWYLGTLIPVIGLAQVGSQAMADRFTYIPLIGPFAIIAWSARELFRALKVHWLVPAVLAAGCLVLLAVGSFYQIGYWQNSITLHNRTVAVMPDNAAARMYLSTSYMEAKQFDRAVEQLKQMPPSFPNQWEVNENLGLCYFQLQNYQQSLIHLQKALQLNPKAEKSLVCLGCIYLQVGRIPEAKAVFEEVLKIQPGYLPAVQALQIIERAQKK
jgi:protein O-mannosyl-transferase